MNTKAKQMMMNGLDLYAEPYTLPVPDKIVLPPFAKQAGNWSQTSFPLAVDNEAVPHQNPHYVIAPSTSEEALTENSPHHSFWRQTTSNLPCKRRAAAVSRLASISIDEATLRLLSAHRD